MKWQPPAQGPRTSPPAPTPHPVIRLQFHLSLAESRLNNLFGRYRKPTPGAGKCESEGSRGRGRNDKQGRLAPPNWSLHLAGGVCPRMQGTGSARTSDPRACQSLPRFICKMGKVTPSYSPHEIKRLKGPHRPEAPWVLIPATSFPPLPFSLCWLGILSCTPKPGSEPAQRTCLVHLPPCLSLPGRNVQTQGTTVNKTKPCSHGALKIRVENKQV